MNVSMEIKIRKKTKTRKKTRIRKKTKTRKKTRIRKYGTGRDEKEHGQALLLIEEEMREKRKK